MLDEYLDAIGIDDAVAVVDFGCGTGVASRRIASRPDFSAHVTGIDRSPFLIRTATRLANEQNLAGRIDFRVGDTQSLDLGAADLMPSSRTRLISHVEQPPHAGRSPRVTKPGGSIGIFDGDYASVTFGYPDPEQGNETTKPDRCHRHQPACHAPDAGAALKPGSSSSPRFPMS